MGMGTAMAGTAGNLGVGAVPVTRSSSTWS